MKERNASLDLLRVVITVMIVAGHAIIHGGILDAVELYSFEYYAANLLLAFLYVHVNCYVLLSGYFLCEKQFSAKKAFALWGQTLFWSVSLFFLISLLEGSATIDLKEMIKSFLPFTQQRYWFMTTYLLMYILVPFLNAGYKVMSKEQHKKVLMTFFLVYILLQNVFYFRTFTGVTAASPMFFCFLYLVGAYIRRYGVKAGTPWLLGYVVTSFITAMSRFLASWISMSMFGREIGTSILYGYTSITVVLGAVCLFLVFLNLKISGNGKIGKFAIWASPLTLGVYLIHDHPNVRDYIWAILSPYKFAESKLGVIVVVLVDAVIIFMVACLMEKCRKMVTKKLENIIMRRRNINGKGYV